MPRLGIIGSVFLALARALGETMAVTMVIGNDPAIHASLFAPGYTIAAVIANEFTEATGNTYLSALVELGLVLFGLTMVINGLAQLLIVLTTKKGSAKGMTMLANARRNAVNIVMLTLCGVCAFVTVSTLFVILGYLVYNGGKSVNLEFFHQASACRPDRLAAAWPTRSSAARRSWLLATLIGSAGRLFCRHLSGRVRRQDVCVPRALYRRSAERHSFDRDRHFRLDGRRGSACIISPLWPADWR